MATINFLYRSTKEKANLNLRLLFRHDDKDFVIGANTQLEVSKLYWTKQHKKKSKEIEITNKQVEVNTELNKIENHVLNAFKTANMEDVNKDWLQTQIDEYYNPPQQAESLPTELIKYFDKYIEFQKKEVTQNTLKKYNVVKQLVTRYQKSIKKTILITDIDTNFKLDFEKYCEKNHYAPNTTAKTIQFIKSVCRHARFNGLATSHQLDNIKTKFKETDTVYLTDTEITAIEELKDLNDYLDNARDWLLISCYTGQRVSDFMRFTKDMIRYEKNKAGVMKPFIEFTQKKTSKKMTVPLSSKVIQILNKRAGDFPRVTSDQKYNDYIKLVCEEAKLNTMTKGSIMTETSKDSGIYRKEKGIYKKYELVTSHIGRRSFASNNYGKIPTSFLINMTGHSTEVMFLNYIGKSNKDMSIEASQYFD